MTSPTTSPVGERVEPLASRLARLAEKAKSGTGMSDAATNQAVLAARARVLAKPRVLHDEAATKDRMDVLVFRIGEERLAVPLHSIVAIIRAVIITPLPRAVAPVFGVTAWRGRPLTVLSIGAITADVLRRLVVLGDGRRAVAALMVDSAEDTRVVTRTELSPAQAGARARIAIGVTDDGTLVLDADALLDAARPEP